MDRYPAGAPALTVNTLFALRLARGAGGRELNQQTTRCGEIIMPDTSHSDHSARRSVGVDVFTNSVLDLNAPTLGPLQDGGTIMVNTAPG